MTTASIREKLYDFIRVADDKKLKGLYLMLEDEINEELEWWKDNAFVKELNNRYSAREDGKQKAYSQNEIDSTIERLKRRRSSK